MGSMTMSFRVQDPKLARGLTPGGRVRFTLKQAGADLVVVELRKERGP